MRIYIRQAQYPFLAKLMANCRTLVGLHFPVSSVHAEGLYHTRRADLEIRAPGCLILLSSDQGYDAEHVEALDGVELVTLCNIPTEPGWWMITS